MDAGPAWSRSLGGKLLFLLFLPFLVIAVVSVLNTLLSTVFCFCRPPSQFLALPLLLQEEPSRTSPTRRHRHHSHHCRASPEECIRRPSPAVWPSHVRITCKCHCLQIDMVKGGVCVLHWLLQGSPIVFVGESTLGAEAAGGQKDAGGRGGHPGAALRSPASLSCHHYHHQHRPQRSMGWLRSCMSGELDQGAGNGHC